MEDGVKRTLLVCDCEDVRHQIIIEQFIEDNNNDIYATIHLAPYSFFKRLWNGLRYIFGYRCDFGDFEEFIFKKEHIKALEEIVKLLKENK